MQRNEDRLLDAAEYRRLVRLCAVLSGEPGAAEDLAQETLLEAWRNLHKLYDPEGADRWLTAIARNVCRRWARQRAREPRVEDLPPPEAVELEERLEQEERRALVARALELVPEEARDVLVQRYVLEAPHTETALRLGISEAAVSMRLTRGKSALTRALNTELREDAEALGLVGPEEVAWETTRIWCRHCGAATLRVARDTGNGAVYFRCPSCEPESDEPGSQFRLDNPLFARLLATVARPSAMLRRVADWSWQYFSAGDTGRVDCTRCGAEAPLRRYVRSEGNLGSQYGLAAVCPKCGEAVSTSVAALAAAAPAVRSFHRTHPRTRSIVHEDAGSIVVRFEAPDAATEIVFARETLRAA